MTVTASDIGRIFREQYGRAVAVLVRVFGDIDVAEEAVQDAFTAAILHWPVDGLPPSPAGWIITTARNRAIDRLRREASREERHESDGRDDRHPTLRRRIGVQAFTSRARSCSARPSPPP